MTNPLDRAFFELDSLLSNPHSNRLDSIMPTSAFYILANALKELKRSVDK